MQFNNIRPNLSLTPHNMLEARKIFVNDPPPLDPAHLMLCSLHLLAVIDEYSSVLWARDDSRQTLESWPSFLSNIICVKSNKKRFLLKWLWESWPRSIGWIYWSDPQCPLVSNTEEWWSNSEYYQIVEIITKRTEKLREYKIWFIDWDSHSRHCTLLRSTKIFQMLRLDLSRIIYTGW